MCWNCWQERGSPSGAPPELVEEFRQLHDAVYAQPNGGCGGNLHVVLDDMNLDDDSVFSARAGGHGVLSEVERQCVEFLVKLNEQERLAVYAGMEGWA